MTEAIKVWKNDRAFKSTNKQSAYTDAMGAAKKYLNEHRDTLATMYGNLTATTDYEGQKRDPKSGSFLHTYYAVVTGVPLEKATQSMGDTAEARINKGRGGDFGIA